MIEFTLEREKYYHRHRDIAQWCCDQFGDNFPNYRWYQRFAFGTQFMQFEREEDASLFALYWL